MLPLHHRGYLVVGNWDGVPLVIRPDPRPFEVEGLGSEGVCQNGGYDLRSGSWPWLVVVAIKLAISHDLAI